jgi:hypothetical protein
LCSGTVHQLLAYQLTCSRSPDANGIADACGSSGVVRESKKFANRELVQAHHVHALLQRLHRANLCHGVFRPAVRDAMAKLGPFIRFASGAFGKAG